MSDAEDMLAAAVAQARADRRARWVRYTVMLVARVAVVALHTTALWVALGEGAGVRLSWLTVGGGLVLWRVVAMGASLSDLWSRRLHDHVFGREVTDAAAATQAVVDVGQAVVLVAVVWGLTVGGSL